MADIVTTRGLETYEDAKTSDFATESDEIDCTFIEFNKPGSPTKTRERELEAAIDFCSKWFTNSQSTTKLFLIDKENDWENFSHLIETQREFESLITDHSQQHDNRNEKMC